MNPVFDWDSTKATLNKIKHGVSFEQAITLFDDPEFLEIFGLKDLSSLPSLRELEQMIPFSETRNPDEEDPKIREMRRLVGEMKANKDSILNYDPKEDEKILKEIRERVSAIGILRSGDRGCDCGGGEGDLAAGGDSQ